MDKVLGPSVGPTRLRYFQWKFCVFSRWKLKFFQAPVKLPSLETFYRLWNMDEGWKFDEKSLWKARNWSKISKNSGKMLDLCNFTKVPDCAFELIGSFFKKLRSPFCWKSFIDKKIFFSFPKAHIHSHTQLHGETNTLEKQQKRLSVVLILRDKTGERSVVYWTIFVPLIIDKSMKKLKNSFWRNLKEVKKSCVVQLYERLSDREGNLLGCRVTSSRILIDIIKSSTLVIRFFFVLIRAWRSERQREKKRQKADKAIWQWKLFSDFHSQKKLNGANLECQH